MQLTKAQIAQANKLIKKYKFCTLETQKELQENGFFEAVNCALSIMIDEKQRPENQLSIWVADRPKGTFIQDKTFIPMPQFHEVWAVLPELVTNNYFLFSKKINICEAACKLWLKLKKENLL